MQQLRTFALALAAGAFVLTPLYADQWDKKTVITINAPIQIPTTTLQPGTYTLKLLDSMSNRHIVTVWDRDGMHHVTTVLAINNYRLQPTGDSKFTFWETPAGQPPALRAWFYPGDDFGQEFAYPKSKAREIALVSKAEVPTLAGPEPAPAPEPAIATPAPAPDTSAIESPDGSTSAAVTAEVEPTPAPAVVADDAPATAEPEPAPVTPAPEPQAATTPAEMPKTASNWAELVLTGLLTTLAGLATFFVKKETA